MKFPAEVSLCTICLQPIQLEIDRYADESGRPVHEACYINKIATNDRRVAGLFGESKFDCLA